MLELYKGDKACEDLAFDVIYGRDDKARKSKGWRMMIANPKADVGEEFRKLLCMVCDDVVSVVVMRMNTCGAELRNTPTFNENEDFCRTKWRAHFRSVGAIEEVGDYLVKKLGKKNVFFSGKCNELAKSAAAMFYLMKVSPLEFAPVSPLISVKCIILAKLHGTKALVPSLISNYFKTV